MTHPICLQAASPRRFLWPFAVSLLAAFPLLAEGVDQLATDVATDLQSAGCRRVAVVEFTDLEGEVTRVGRHLANEFSVALLAADPSIDLVDREQVEKLIREIGFTHKGLTDPATVQKLGRMLGAQGLIFGEVVSLSESASLSVRVVEIESARTLAWKRVTLPMTSELSVLFYGRSNTSSAPGQPYQVEEYGSFEYRFFPCRRARERITCVVEVVSHKRGMTFQLRGKVRALDPRGDQHELWHLEANQGSAGRGSVSAELIEDIPLRLTLIFEGVSTEVTKIALDLESHPKPILVTGIPVVD